MEHEPFVFSQFGRLLASRRTPETPETEDDDAALLGAVNHFALQPLAREDFAVFRMDLCHNQIDRHFSRFPDEELARMNEMAPGRPLMERHDLRGSLPRGVFFRSELHREGERLSVRPEAYVLRTAGNADFIRNIEGGVYRETSVGFSFRLPECSVCGKDLRTCAHVPGKSYGGKQCHFIMREVLEVIEGSVVASGSQGTGFVPEQRQGPLPLGEALEAARARFHAPIVLRERSMWADE